MKKKVFSSVLSMKFAKGKIKFIDKLDFTEPSTKKMVQFINDLDLHGKTLIILDNKDTNIIKSASNVKGLETAQTANLNAYQMLLADNIVMTKNSIAKLEEKCK
jgi:large subunit ribosomal protein L4